MKTPLKEGDRVRVSGYGKVFELIPGVTEKIYYAIHENPIVTIINDPDSSGLFVGRDDHGKKAYFHKRQVTKRLIKKPKKPLREIWVKYFEGSLWAMFTSKEHSEATLLGLGVECVHFVEKREKKK